MFDADLLFTDIDSLTYEIKSENIYGEFFKNKHLYDFSEYQSEFFDSTNQKVIDKMKYVYKGKPICEFISLKSKVHCILPHDGKESNTAKGVNTAIELNGYKYILFNKKVIRQNMRRAQSKNHKTGTYEVKKTSLSRFDDKSYILDDGVHTLAYFHKNLKN